MTILLVLLAAALAVGGYVTYKIGAPNIEKLKEQAEDALYKVEPALKSVEEVLEKAEKVAPKNKVVKMAAKQAKITVDTVKKIKTKKQK